MLKLILQKKKKKNTVKHLFGTIFWAFLSKKIWNADKPQYSTI